MLYAKIPACPTAPGCICSMQASMNFWLFCPTTLCTAEDTSHRLSCRESRQLAVFQTHSLSLYFKFCITHCIRCMNKRTRDQGIITQLHYTAYKSAAAICTES